MEVINGQGRKLPKPNLKMVEYKALLAKIHIALRELKIGRREYLNILARSFGVGSATCLSNQELKRLVNLFERMGWKPRAPEGGRPAAREVILAWQERARETAKGHGAGWEKQLRAMLEEECGVREVTWCRDIGALRRVCRRLEEAGAGAEKPRRTGSSGN